MFPIKRTLKVYGFYYYSIVFGLYYNLAVLYYIQNNKFPPISLFIYSFIIITSYYLLALFCLFKKYNLYKFLYIRYFHFFGLIFYLSLYSIVFYPIYMFSNFSKETYILIYTIPSIINVIFGLINERLLYADRYKIKIKGMKKQIKLVHLSDFHLGAVYGEEEVDRIVNMILKEKCDLVVITGDIIDGNMLSEKKMIEPFSKLKVPIYYITGNHEYYGDYEQAIDIINNCGYIKYLKNENIVFNDAINIIGKEFDFNIEKAKMDIKELIPKNNLPNMLLYHSPIYDLEDLPSLNVNLYLCGHLHGGQMFPYDFIKHCIYYKRSNGLFCIDENYYMYLTAGTCTSVPLLRTMASPNFGVITIN